MSVEAQVCAMRIKLPPGNSTAKHVLTILANHANGDPCVEEVVEAWPSIKSLVDSTGQDRKTVIMNLKRLQEWGLIEDSGRRVGRTGQVVVYNLHIAPDLLSEQFRNRDRSKSPNIGTVPKSEQFQNRQQTVPIFRGNSTDIGTRNHQGTIREEHTHGAGDFEGTFEGHEDPAPPAVPTTAGTIAAELRRRGYRVTSMDPNLLKAIDAGLTLALALEYAELYPPDHEKSAGSAAYLLGAARGQLTTPIDPAPAGGSHVRQPRESEGDRIRRIAIEAEERDRAGAGAYGETDLVDAHG